MPSPTASASPTSTAEASPTTAAAAEPPPPNVPAATPTPAPAVSLPVEVTTDDLNVRLGAGLGYPVRGQLNSGDTADAVVLSNDGEWLGLDGLGWVFRDDAWLTVRGDVDTLTRAYAAYYGLVGPSYGAETRTGFRDVDAVIDAVLAGDLDGFASLLRVYADVCPRAPSGPPSCPASEGEHPSRS